MINKGKFFDQFRPYYKAKTGKQILSNSVVESVDFLLDSFEDYPQWSDFRNVAYALATIAHETAWTFRPIKEYRNAVGTKGRANQDRYWSSGYYGRGYVQLTWLKNYKKAESELGEDLVNHPDLALEPKIAFKILTYGMFEGWFTSQKLSYFINSQKTDFFNARTIINGHDKADRIKKYAEDFLKMLNSSNEDEDSGDDLIKRTVMSEPVKEEKPDVDEAVTKPVDDYPEEPKPGEPAPDETAKPGEPVVGGRPGDPPKTVESVQPTETSGWGAWVANVRAQWATLGISAASLGSVFTGFVTNPIFIYILCGVVAVALIAGLIIYLHSMSIKSKEKMERERQAFELTKLQAEKAADPTKYNIAVVK